MEYLDGWGDPIEINQIRMDVKGQIGVIVGITSEAIMLQISDRTIEFIPSKDHGQFAETTFSLGSIY